MRNKKILSMLLAVVISLGIWLYVVLVENPEKTATLYNIPVTFSGEDVLREDYDLIIGSTNVESGVTLISGAACPSSISSGMTSPSWRS